VHKRACVHKGLPTLEDTTYNCPYEKQLFSKSIISPLAQSVRIFNLMTFFFKDFTCNLVPLNNFGTFKFRIQMIGAPIFKVSLCGKSPGRFNELKNSTGKSVDQQQNL